MGILAQHSQSMLCVICDVNVFVFAHLYKLDARDSCEFWQKWSVNGEVKSSIIRPGRQMRTAGESVFLLTWWTESLMIWVTTAVFVRRSNPATQHCIQFSVHELIKAFLYQTHVCEDSQWDDEKQEDIFYIFITTVCVCYISQIHFLSLSDVIQ